MPRRSAPSNRPVDSAMRPHLDHQDAHPRSRAHLPGPVRSRVGAHRRESAVRQVRQENPANGSRLETGPDEPEGDDEFTGGTASVR